MFGMAPAVSCTGMSVLSNAFFWRLPHQKYGPSCALASSSRRVFTADSHFTCVIMLGWFSLVMVPSGELIDAPKPSPVPSPPTMQLIQEYWTLLKKVILLRGVACQVNRTFS